VGLWPLYQVAFIKVRNSGTGVSPVHRHRLENLCPPKAPPRAAVLHKMPSGILFGLPKYYLFDGNLVLAPFPTTLLPHFTLT